ncbi:hypothetical protein [Kitasatospora sp. NPDC057223]|uniref:hypothetical protein n=1 Tax=Kitasatospora sp. NPDC057223 TaxID=3346055 RepID=UPI0036358AA9
MGIRDEDIVSAVRAVRVERPDLWAAGGGSWADTAEALLLRSAAGERVGDDLLAVLTPETAVREELGRRLAGEHDTYRGAEPGSGFAPLAGHGDPSTEFVHGCTTCDYTYPVFEAGEPVPEGCPDGHGPLVRLR